MDNTILSKESLQRKYEILMEAAINKQLGLTLFYDSRKGLYIPVIVKIDPLDLMKAIAEGKEPDFTPLAILLDDPVDNAITPVPFSEVN